MIAIERAHYETASRTVYQWLVEAPDGHRTYFRRRWAAKQYADALGVSDAAAAEVLRDLRQDGTVL